jgi:hypothetical protein
MTARVQLNEISGRESRWAYRQDVLTGGILLVVNNFDSEFDFGLSQSVKRKPS